MTEGYIWTDIYPESKRIIEKGNNQSMELDDKKINAYWSKDKNGMPEFFIINEAIIKKLCILGEDCEPCFEGANITAPTMHFSFSDKFNEQLFSMMKDLKELLEGKGGTKVFTRYNVEIGDSIWTSLYSYIKGFGAGNAMIEEVCEDNGNLFAVVKEDDKFVRLDFSMENDTFTPGEVSELTDYSVSDNPQFDPEKVAEFAKKRTKKIKTIKRIMIIIRKILLKNSQKMVKRRTLPKINLLILLMKKESQLRMMKRKKRKRKLSTLQKMQLNMVY